VPCSSNTTLDACLQAFRRTNPPPRLRTQESVAALSFGMVPSTRRTNRGRNDRRARRARTPILGVRDDSEEHQMVRCGRPRRSDRPISTSCIPWRRSRGPAVVCSRTPLLNEPTAEHCAGSFISSLGLMFRGRRRFTGFRRALVPEPGRKEARAPRPPHRSRWHPCAPTRVPRPYRRIPISKIRPCAPWSRCTVRR
jgi:hypothetical protein